MAPNIADIAKTIEKEAQDKYNGETLLADLQSHNTDIFLEVVEFFRAQEVEHPHLEAYEVYGLVEESLPENPGKEEIRKVIDGLLNLDVPE